jgi:hypothetical protein
MTIEQPRFPTPEDELLASQLYQAVRKLADGERAVSDTEAPDSNEPAEARVTKV